jgi:hypothetical protein
MEKAFPDTDTSPLKKQLNKTVLYKAYTPRFIDEYDFGGVNIQWKNEHKAPVTICLLAADESGVLSMTNVIFTDSAEGKYNLRGFDDIERTFGVFVRDHLDHYSDTLLGKFTPFNEMKSDKSLFRRKTLLGDNTGVWSDDYQFEYMWDDLVDRLSNTYHQKDASDPNYFTIDLGVATKLSRYTLWQRPGYFYARFNPKRWKVYGATNLSSSTNPEYWIDGGFKNDWFLLADCYAFKPSGEDHPVTPKDIEYATLGHEFEFLAEAPPVRFIRFQMLESWSKSMTFYISEVTFWGTVLQ